MRFIFILISVAFLGRHLSAQTIYAPPVLAITNEDSAIQVIPPQESAFRVPENLEYQVQFKNRSYNLVISYMTETTSLADIREVMQQQFNTNEAAKLITNETFDDWLLIQFSQSFGKIADKEITMGMEIAMTVFGDVFLIGISAEHEAEADLNKDMLIELVSRIQPVTPAKMDEYLGLPLTEKKKTELLEKAFLSNDENAYARAQRDYESQFSYFDYFNILKNIQEGRYTLDDMLYMFFEKQVKGDLARFRNMVSPDLNYPIIEGNYPTIRDQFMNEVATGFLMQNEIIADIQLLSEADRTFMITYSTQDAAAHFTRILKFELKGGYWKGITIELPEKLRMFDPFAGNWSIEESSEQWLIIRVAPGREYYARNPKNDYSDWISINTFVGDTTVYAAAYTGCFMMENTGFQKDAIHIFRNPVFESKLREIESSLIDKSLAVPCDHEGSYARDNLRLLYFPGYCVSNSYYAPDIHRNMGPEKVAFISRLQRIDINGDGKEELFTYTVSNGKLADVSGVTMQQGKVKPVSRKVVRRWLRKNPEAYNLMLYSKMKY